MGKNPDQILIISNNADLVQALRVILRGQFEVSSFETLIEARGALPGVNCILIDMSNTERKIVDDLGVLLEKTTFPVITIINENDIQTRKEAIGAGIYDYLDFPLDPDRVAITLKRAVAAPPLPGDLRLKTND